MKDIERLIETCEGLMVPPNQAEVWSTIVGMAKAELEHLKEEVGRTARHSWGNRSGGSGFVRLDDGGDDVVYIAVDHIVSLSRAGTGRTLVHIHGALHAVDKDDVESVLKRIAEARR